MDTPQVDILLATYNGEAFICQLLESIESQTFGNWRLLIRDDCSTDNTMQKIIIFAKEHGRKVKVINNKNSRLGIVRNFNALLAKSTSEYIMFADQDDIWLPNKISITLSRIIGLENNDDIPILVHTDLHVVDKQLNSISESFFGYQGINPDCGTALKDIMVQNIVTGCTIMVNRKLANLIMLIPEKAIMHDWWIGMCAAAFGHIDFITQPTILYRQHERNDTGAKKWNLFSSLLCALYGNNIHRKIVDSELQASAFLEHYKYSLTKQQIVTLSQFGALEEKNFLARRIIAVKLGLRKHNFFRTFGLYLFL